MDALVWLIQTTKYILPYLYRCKHYIIARLFTVVVEVKDIQGELNNYHRSIVSPRFVDYTVVHFLESSIRGFTMIFVWAN